MIAQVKVNEPCLRSPGFITNSIASLYFFRQREEQNGGTALHCTARKLEKYFKMNVEQYADRDKKRALCMWI